MITPQITTEESSLYTFAVGKIRVLEASLLPPSLFYQLAEVKGLEEISSTLASTTYAESISRIENHNFADFLEGEELASLHLIKNLSAEDFLTLPFFWKRDFHNLKLILKADFSLVKKEFLKEGTFSKDFFWNVIEDKDVTLLPPLYQLALDRARKGYERDKQYQMVDIILDKELFAQIFRLTWEHPFIQDYFRREADLLNIKSFLRCKDGQESKDFFSKTFLPGGLLEINFFLSFYEDSLDSLQQRLKFTPYSLLSEDGLPYWQKNRYSWKIDNNCWTLALQYLSKAKYTAFGYAPLLRYYILGMNERRNLRTVFVGKETGIEIEKIKERLGPFYE